MYIIVVIVVIVIDTSRLFQFFLRTYTRTTCITDSQHHKTFNNNKFLFLFSTLCFLSNRHKFYSSCASIILHTLSRITLLWKRPLHPHSKPIYFYFACFITTTARVPIHIMFTIYIPTPRPSTVSHTQSPANAPPFTTLLQLCNFVISIVNVFFLFFYFFFHHHIDNPKHISLHMLNICIISISYVTDHNAFKISTFS